MTTRERIKTAISDYLNKYQHHNFGAQTMTATKAQSSVVSLWKNKKEDSRLRLYGTLQLTGELIQQLMETEPNEYGQFELRIALFRNDSDNLKAPILKGRIELPQVEMDDEF